MTSNKDYKKRKKRKKKIHVNEFRQEVLDRFNQLRKLSGVPMIKSSEDLAINTVFRKVKMK